MDTKTKLIKAFECHDAGRLLEAHQLYGEAVQELDATLKNKKIAPDKEKAFMIRVNEFVSIFEQISNRIKHLLTPGSSVESIEMSEDDIGYSYSRVFGKYLTADVKEVYIRESYLRVNHQFRNLVMFLELLVKSCHNLKYVRVVTKPSDQGVNQKDVFNKIKADLEKRGVTFNYQYEDFHDRKILLDNGYLFTLGKGLDYFKPCEEYSLGTFDYDFRKCIETGITVFRTKSF